LPQYLVGTDQNYYSPKPLDFRANFIVTADSPYSRPTLIEPFDASDDRNVELACEWARWIDEIAGEKFSLWEIWTSKTVVTDMDGNVIHWQQPGGPDIPPNEPSRRVARRG
jgi:hypothetical protein